MIIPPVYLLCFYYIPFFCILQVHIAQKSYFSLFVTIAGGKITSQNSNIHSFYHTKSRSHIRRLFVKNDLLQQKTVKFSFAEKQHLPKNATRSSFCHLPFVLLFLRNPIPFDSIFFL